MATASKTGKGKAAAAVALGQTADKAKAAKETAIAVIPNVKAKALSVDVGPAVIASMVAYAKDEQKAQEMLSGVASKRYDALSKLTMAIVKAGKADSTIDLKATMGTGNDGTKAMGLLNDQLGIALGFKEVVDVKGKKEGEKVQRVVYAKAVSAYFPMPGETSKEKSSTRSNFLHMLKKAARVALGIIENDIGAKYDPKAGTLALSGPAVQKQFGQSTVLLDEKQNVAGKKGEEIKLKEKPSFTAIAAAAAKDHGVIVPRVSNTRGVGTNPTQAMESICKSLVAACEAIVQAKRDPNEKEITALESVQSAVDKVLNG